PADVHARRAARLLRALLHQQRDPAGRRRGRAGDSRVPTDATRRTVHPSHLQGHVGHPRQRVRTHRFTLPVMAVHPWNKEFEWQTPPAPYRRITEAQAKQWDDAGYFLLEDAIDRDALADVEAAIDPFEEQFADWLRSRGGTLGIADAEAITFTIHLVLRN